MALEVTVVKDMVGCVVEKDLTSWTCGERSRSCGEEDRMEMDRRRLVISIDRFETPLGLQLGLSRLFVRLLLIDSVLRNKEPPQPMATE